MGYLLLIVAIVLEVIATSALKASAGFTRLWPALVVVFGYGGAFYCLAHVMKRCLWAWHMLFGALWALFWWR